MIPQFLYYKHKLDFAFDRLEVASAFKDKSVRTSGVARALELRDEAIDGAMAHARATNRRFEDLLDLPR